MLEDQFQRLLVERDSPIPIRRWGGLVVPAASGAGKTRMLTRFLKNHPSVVRFGMDDTNFVNITVPSPVTNKSLGLEVLRTVYPQRRSARGLPTSTASAEVGLSDIWHEAREIAEECGVWGLWIDEAHDLRNGGPKMLDILQASLKRWMAQGHRPIIILSGTPNVEDIFLTREFRRRFLEVKSPPLTADANTRDLRKAIAQFLERVELGIDGSLGSFMPRLIHAGTRQIGWTIDVILEAIREALLDQAPCLTLDHFAQSYGDFVQCPPNENPFISEDWSGIDTLLHRSRDAPSSTSRRRRKRESSPW